MTLQLSHLDHSTEVPLRIPCEIRGGHGDLVYIPMILESKNTSPSRVLGIHLKFTGSH